MLFKKTRQFLKTDSSRTKSESTIASSASKRHPELNVEPLNVSPFLKWVRLRLTSSSKLQLMNSTWTAISSLRRSSAPFIVAPWIMTPRGAGLGFVKMLRRKQPLTIEFLSRSAGLPLPTAFVIFSWVWSSLAKGLAHREYANAFVSGQSAVFSGWVCARATRSSGADMKANASPIDNK